MNRIRRLTIECIPFTLRAYEKATIEAKIVKNRKVLQTIKMRMGSVYEWVAIKKNQSVFMKKGDNLGIKIKNVTPKNCLINVEVEYRK